MPKSNRAAAQAWASSGSATSRPATMSKSSIHADNKKRWDAAASRWAERADNRGLWRRCPSEPGLVLCPKELDALGDLTGRHVCVLGSGDNQVAFALAGLGARVTSVDISQNQLDVAQARAETLGLEMAFVCADVTDLSGLGSDVFDAVYTGGHVAIWVADLGAYYAEATRILAPGGLFLINEYHPFRRIWQASQTEMIVESAYLTRGPFTYQKNEDVLRPETGTLASHEFHWTMADMLNAVIGAGCRVTSVDEYGEDVGDWEAGPMHGLPEFFLIIARKLDHPRQIP